MRHTFFVGSDADEDLDEPATLSGRDIIDPFDFVYSNLPRSTHVLQKVPNCKHCKAKRFEYESQGLCCLNGQFKLHEPESIPELMKLWSSMNVESRHFREKIWYFNGHFSFTTLGVILDTSCTNMSSGVYTFKACDTIYHNTHDFGPGSRPEHLQLYFYDDNPTLSRRKEATKQLHKLKCNFFLGN